MIEKRKGWIFHSLKLPLPVSISEIFFLLLHKIEQTVMFVQLCLNDWKPYLEHWFSLQIFVLAVAVSLDNRVTHFPVQHSGYFCLAFSSKFNFSYFVAPSSGCIVEWKMEMLLRNIQYILHVFSLFYKILLEIWNNYFFY